jgi:hypothetical protein
MRPSTSNPDPQFAAPFHYTATCDSIAMLPLDSQAAWDGGAEGRVRGQRDTCRRAASNLCGRDRGRRRSSDAERVGSDDARGHGRARPRRAPPARGQARAAESASLAASIRRRSAPRGCAARSSPGVGDDRRELDVGLLENGVDVARSCAGAACASASGSSAPGSALGARSSRG